MVALEGKFRLLHRTTVKEEKHSVLYVFRKLHHQNWVPWFRETRSESSVTHLHTSARVCSIVLRPNRWVCCSQSGSGLPSRWSYTLTRRRKAPPRPHTSCCPKKEREWDGTVSLWWGRDSIHTQAISLHDLFLTLLLQTWHEREIAVWIIALTSFTVKGKLPLPTHIKPILHDVVLQNVVTNECEVQW